jgi:dihydrodipicolinate synthase/N-acetylneuraminate lyase
MAKWPNVSSSLSMRGGVVDVGTAAQHTTAHTLQGANGWISATALHMPSCYQSRSVLLTVLVHLWMPWP